MPTIIQVDGGALVSAAALIGGGIVAGLKLAGNAIARAWDRSTEALLLTAHTMGRADRMVELAEERSGVHAVPPELELKAEPPPSPAMKAAGYGKQGTGGDYIAYPRAKSEPRRGG